MEKETPEENLNQACVRVLKEMTKETLDQAQQKYCPYHGKKVPCGACQDLMDKTYKETPTECPDCKCTNLVSDQCKGECVCHHPELTPTEEWEKEFIEKGADLEHTRWANWQQYL